MSNLVLEGIRTMFRKYTIKERQKMVPIRGIITYKQSCLLSSLQQKNLSIGFFEYYIEKISTCKKVNCPGIIVLGRTDTDLLKSVVNNLIYNSIHNTIMSGEDILYNNTDWKFKAVLKGNLVIVEIDERVDATDFYFFVKREAGSLGVRDFIISANRKRIIVDFFSEEDVSWGAIEKIFKVFSVKKYIYINLN